MWLLRVCEAEGWAGSLHSAVLRASPLPVFSVISALFPHQCSGAGHNLLSVVSFLRDAARLVPGTERTLRRELLPSGCSVPS